MCFTIFCPDVNFIYIKWKGRYWLFTTGIIYLSKLKSVSMSTELTKIIMTSSVQVSITSPPPPHITMVSTNRGRIACVYIISGKKVSSSCYFPNLCTTDILNTVDPCLLEHNKLMQSVGINDRHVITAQNIAVPRHRKDLFNDIYAWMTRMEWFHSIKIENYSFKKMHLNKSSTAKWRPFGPGWNELKLSG